MIQNLIHIRNIIFGLLVMIILCSCVKDRNFNSLKGNYVEDLEANISYAEVKALFQEQTFQIQEDLIIEGYVTSSDIVGNFFNVLHFQDKPENATEGFL